MSLRKDLIKMGYPKQMVHYAESTYNSSIMNHLNDGEKMKIFKMVLMAPQVYLIPTFDGNPLKELATKLLETLKQ